MTSRGFYVVKTGRGQEVYLGVEELAGWTVFREACVAHGAGDHERLCNDRQTCVHDTRLPNVKHEVWILHDINPKPQRKTAKDINK